MHAPFRYYADNCADQESRGAEQVCSTGYVREASVTS